MSFISDENLKIVYTPIEHSQKPITRIYMSWCEGYERNNLGEHCLPPIGGRSNIIDIPVTQGFSDKYNNQYININYSSDELDETFDRLVATIEFRD